MKIHQFVYTLIFLLSSLACDLFAQPASFKGQVSGWAIKNSTSSDYQLGLRYIPELAFSKPIRQNFGIDVDLSLNNYLLFDGQLFDEYQTQRTAKFYRFWVRFAGKQYEVRFGLQKINFGSATLLRPLMWFDRIDPRDPLQLTDGVYGALARYFFLNNANLWLWVLYGNDEVKGWEIFPAKKKSIEYGGRLQYPLGSGEIALTFHRRKITLPSDLIFDPVFDRGEMNENRYAVDGKWDLGIGLWFEGALTEQPEYFAGTQFQRLANLGMDYTFGIGNGLHLMVEHLYLSTSDKLFTTTDKANFSALLADYPVGLLDRLNVIFYYDWKNDNLYNFFRWGRVYDNWSFFLLAFWNPEQNTLYQMKNQTNYFGGKGIQLLIVFNH